MSYDVSLYFRDAVFPLEQWQEVISSFSPRQHEVQLANETDSRLASWTVNRDDETSWLSLRDVSSASHSKPIPSHWEISISRVGHSPKSVWLQFAVPYNALNLLDAVTFYDRQHDLTISDEADYLRFAGHVLSGLGLSKVFKLGLTNAQGVPLF